MSSHLLLIGIGPVHEFIERARRTRDVWFGSWILSELAATVARSLSDSRCTLIFPDPQTLARLSPQPQSDDSASENPKKEAAKPSHAAIANQILARTDADPATVISNARTAFTAQVKKFVIKTPQITVLAQAEYNRALAQIEDLFEFHWASVPLASEIDYPKQRTLLYRLFNARKHTRTFGSIPWEQTSATNATNRRSNKSSLDGWREKVTAGTKQGENLSGVDMLKRYTQPDGVDTGFPSTSHMAALPFAQHLGFISGTTEQANEGWNRYIAELWANKYPISEYLPQKSRFRHISLFGEYDGSLLFESRLGEDLDRTQYKTIVKTAQESLRRLIKAYASGEPNPYYAILAADGDHMGDLINTIETIGEHQKVSETVAAFAQEAAQIVEKQHQGAVIYAGGDDVLALLPLHTVLDCAQKLAALFDETMRPCATPNSKPLTLSVGIAIVHHLEALQESFALARTAEKIAKKQRDSLAIILSKRNGGDTTIAGRWNSPFFGDLQWLVTQHQSKQLPDGFIFELRELHQRFDFSMAQDANEAAIWQKIIELEAKRILERKQTPRGKKVSAEVIEKINQMLGSLGATDAAQRLDEVVDLNIVARELAAMKWMVEGDGVERMPDE